MRLLEEPEALFQRWRKSAPRPLFWTVAFWLWGTVIYLALHLATGLRMAIAILDFSLLLTAGLMIMVANWMVFVRVWNWAQRHVSTDERGD